MDLYFLTEPVFDKGASRTSLGTAVHGLFDRTLQQTNRFELANGSSVQCLLARQSFSKINRQVQPSRITSKKSLSKENQNEDRW